MKSKQKICSGLGVFFAILGVLTAYAYAIDGNDSVKNQYFSINIPDSWTYTEYSNTGMSQLLGRGPVNDIELTPSEFSDMLLNRDIEKVIEKIQVEGSPYASFSQDTNYPIKNAPLESYVKYKIDNYGILNITSQHYTTIGKEKAVKIYSNESASFGNTKTALYFVMHDKQPYQIVYLANAKNYEKYLPEFEQMVKSFRFVGSPSEIENLPENQNGTNTATNFSGVNLNRPYIGIAGLSLTPELSKQIGLNQTKGFLLTFITKGSPADNAGLRAGTNTTTINGRDIIVGGDVVLKIDNREVSNIDDIKAYVSQKHPGDNVHLTILRDNTIREPDVILGISPSQDRINSPSNDFSNRFPNDGNKNQEELYNECVNVAGKSLCDFLFKR
jgi:PDZ domain